MAALSAQGGELLRDVSLTVPTQQVAPSNTIALLGRARSNAASDLTFLFFVSSTQSQQEQGTVFSEQTATGCNTSLGCAVRADFAAAAGFGQHFFRMEARQDSLSVSTDKLPVEVVSADEVRTPAPPSPQSCSCGSTVATVDAGAPTARVLGGESLPLQAEISVTGAGSGITPDSFQWAFIDDGGLGGALQIEGSDKLQAILMTPDVDQDRQVNLEILAVRAGCGCRDSVQVTILADPPPLADLSVTVSGPLDSAIQRREIEYQFTVRNDGPQAAPDVELAFPIPDGTTFDSALWDQGACSQQDSQLVCLLGTLTESASVGVAVRLQAELDGHVAALAVVSSIATDEDVGNNVAIEITLVDPIQELFFAQFGDGGDTFFSQIILYNLDSNRASPTRLFLRGDEGEPLNVDLNGEQLQGEAQLLIPANGLRTLRTDGLGDLEVGSVSVEAERPLAGVILFGGAVGLAGVGSSAELPSGFLAPMQVEDSKGINTGIAAVNLEDNPVTLDLRLLDADGNLLESSSLSLEAKGHAAKLVDELFMDSPSDLSALEGLLEVTATGRIAATVIQTRPGQFATMPVTPLGLAQATAQPALDAPAPRFQSSPPLPATTEATPNSCTCGQAVVTVDAGSPTGSVVGGRTLILQGTAMGPASGGGGGVSPGFFEWSILTDAGLGSDLRIQDPNMLTARLVTPDIDQSAIVTVVLQAVFSGCACTDSKVITILGDAPPEADLALLKEDLEDPVAETRDLIYRLEVVNNGPDTATSVQLTDTLPSGVAFVSAAATQGGCSLQPGDGLVTCSLGSLAKDAEAEVLLTVRPAAPGLIVNSASVVSALSDPNPANNTDSAATNVQPLQHLYFAQVGDGSGLFFSEILLYNLDRMKPSSLQIAFRDDFGQPLSLDLNGQAVQGSFQTIIPAGGFRVFSTDGLGDLSVGSAVVSSDTPLAGVIIFGGQVGLAGVGSSSALENGLIAPIETNEAAGTRTGVAIINLEDRRAELTLRLLDEDGAEMASVSDHLDPRGHRAQFADEIFAGLGVDFSNFQGLIEITADGARLAATVIQSRPGQFATMPVSGRR